MKTVVIKNIGILFSGKIEEPIYQGSDTLLLQDGKIKSWGNSSLADTAAELVIDAQGAAVAPGLIDSHTHPVLGDYTPRQKMQDFINSSLHGGVTTMISAGEPHTPGRPKDPAGVKALAILAHKSSRNQRPGGVKLHGGALILEKGLTKKDFEELKKEGVWLVGEVGLGSVKDPAEAAEMIRWAHDCGMKVMMHTGGTSIPGSSVVTADDVIKAGPDVASHINGGPTAPPLEEIAKLVNSSEIALEIVHCGNLKAADYAVRLAQEKDALNRIVIGNDAPSGTGVVPLGILRVMAQLASVSQIPAEKVLSMATGNTARLYDLNTGIMEEGREADIAILDAPMGSVGEDVLKSLAAGDIPAVACVIIDGEIVAEKSRNTPPPQKKTVFQRL